MNRPNLPPLRMALSQSMDEFEMQNQQSRQRSDHRHGAHLSGRPSIRGMERPPSASTHLSPGRPGDLSIYSLGSSSSISKYPHGSSSHNSSSIPGSSSPSHQLTCDSNISSLASGQDLKYYSADYPYCHSDSANLHQCPTEEMRRRRESIGASHSPSYMQSAGSECHSNSPQISFAQGNSRYSPDRHDQQFLQEGPSLFVTSPAQANPVGLSRNSSYDERPTSSGQVNSSSWSGGESSNPGPTSSSSSLPASINKQMSSNGPTASPRWVCDYDGCGKTFTRGFNLTQHKAAIHRDERRFECS
ncbi:hypothetical protein CROQUDRAFT_655747 [Cronartium quercuum f. sp. fusiforme G11]|uniref:C2H2-type domain-containing protein n=1 Tax=Cronartium quercuum f. sp. fusiforme G11 TaxID=708437 RepID=A0A9P6NKQ7_9BASI|nr:hypothetical protein CROQUDRAFT_655747 [Cronartium quercuum f. sp. fusiforme G11]